ncbi:MAG TPA: hypothetical protein VK171_13220 [Fimbriimonas sp.]|nr:hypothetical protein [Fimbriimonas sp.]
MQNSRRVLVLILAGAVLIATAMAFRLLNPPKRPLYRTRAISNAKQLSIAALMYASDFDGKMPSQPSRIAKGLTLRAVTPTGFPYLDEVKRLDSVEDVLMPYIKNEMLLDTGQDLRITSKRFEHGDKTWHKLFGSDYGWNDYDLLRGYNVDLGKENPTSVLLYQMEPFPNKLRVIAYMDGHAKVHRAEEAQKAFSRHSFWFLP